MYKKIGLILMLIFVFVGCQEQTQTGILDDFAQQTDGMTPQVVDVEEVQWLDNQYGCVNEDVPFPRPAPDTYGWRILLSDGSDEYNYHTYTVGGDEDFIFCESPSGNWIPK